MPRVSPRKKLTTRNYSTKAVAPTGVESNYDKSISKNLEEFGTFVSREPAKYNELGALLPSVGGSNSTFETNISEAIVLAAKAGQFDVVRMLASELEAHRLADRSVTRARA